MVVVWLAVTNIIRVLIQQNVMVIVGIGLMRMIILLVVSAGKSIGWNMMQKADGNSLKIPITVEILKKMAAMVVFLTLVCTVT